MWKDPYFSFLDFLHFYISFSFFFKFLTAFFLHGIWKLYSYSISFILIMKRFLLLILYMPTLIFWGGGIMKDSYVLGATCWITYNFYQILIARKIIWNILFFALNLFLILNTKICYYFIITWNAFMVK